MLCRICEGNFELSPDKIVLCEHHVGFVHMGCCNYRCSKDGKICRHGKAVYSKL
jgi:hypothetical protein